VFGIILLVGNNMPFLNKNDSINEEKQEFPSSVEYEKKVEEKVIRLCSSVKGAGRVSAVVTLGGGYSAVYAQNSQVSENGYRNEFVLVGTGSNEGALLIGYKEPDIMGIGIICSGGGDEKVRCELVSLVSAAFSISPAKIYVAAAKN
jgi:hypothetical protein